MAQMTIARLGVFSVGKIYGAISAVLGLIAGIVIFFITLLGAAVVPSSRGGNAAMGVASGLMFMILAPIIYGIFGFIMGLIMGLIYNVAAGFAGGIEIELEGAAPPVYNTPPPPPTWAQQNPYQTGGPGYPGGPGGPGY
jgi:hypothetical protein